jgi:hypothetical protein
MVETVSLLMFFTTSTTCTMSGYTMTSSGSHDFVS